ncbi:MAG TPA: hypothetical protein VGN17_10070 [Bryobacteraceae bacterium]|jgi:hypothetical protein
MTLKNAALLAFCGSILLTLLLSMSLVRNILGTVEGFAPAATVLSSLIYVFAGVSAALFFYAVLRRQF